MSSFSKTISISAFAEKQGISELNILKNPKTGSNFLVDDLGNTYRVAKDISALTADLQVSWFSPEDGDASYMLHKKGAGAEVVSKMSFAKTPANFDVF
jgi:hypothetical protein